MFCPVYFVRVYFVPVSFILGPYRTVFARTIVTMYIKRCRCPPGDLPVAPRGARAAFVGDAHPPPGRRKRRRRFCRRRRPRVLSVGDVQRQLSGRSRDRRGVGALRPASGRTVRQEGLRCHRLRRQRHRLRRRTLLRSVALSHHRRRHRPAGDSTVSGGSDVLLRGRIQMRPR